MEFRLLEYFLAVAREQNITAAAESLHISQPALSTQLKALETELGKQLLIRGVKGSRKVVLTEEGMILRKRAEEMISLMRRTEEEITGVGEPLPGMFLSELVKRKPFVCLHRLPKNCSKNIQISGITSPAAMRSMFLNIWIRDSLILDCFLQRLTHRNMRPSRFHVKDTWGVLMRKDSPLADKRKYLPG